MLALERKFLIRQRPFFERREVLGAQPSEFVQQLGEPLALVLLELGLAVQRREAPVGTLGPASSKPEASRSAAIWCLRRVRGDAATCDCSLRSSG
jgi:hypothetical protein